MPELKETSFAELKQRAEERAELVRSATYRQKDKAAFKCPKCGSPMISRVNVEMWRSDEPNKLIYCGNCRDPHVIHASEEIEFE